MMRQSPKPEGFVMTTGSTDTKPEDPKEDEHQEEAHHEEWQEEEAGW